MKKIITFLLTIIILSPINIVKAENLKGSEIKNFPYSKDYYISGIRGESDFYFNIEKQWKVKDCYLNLIFTQSNLVDSNNSNLTVFINDTPIFCTSLGKKLGYKEMVKVLIPKDELLTGFNVLKVKTYRRISDKPCEDDFNLGNWMIIHKESFVHVDFQNINESTSFKEFPYPYLNSGKENLVDSLIIIPDTYGRGERTTALLIAGAFGSYRRFDNLNLKICKISEAKEEFNKNIIFIGKKDNAPQEILNLLSSEELNKLDNSSIIKQISSPFNKDKKILIIISQNEECMIKAAKFLLNSSLVEQVKENSIVINKGMDVEKKVPVPKDKMTLKDLGYDNTTLTGAFSKEAVFNIPLQRERFIMDTAKIFIKCRYSKNLDFDKSLMTVYINDIPIGSKKLEVNNGDNDYFEGTIPEEVRNANYYNVRVNFNLQLKDYYCNIREENSPWAFIDNESYVYLPSNINRDIIFENYYNPFIIGGDFNNLVIVFPDKENSNHLTIGANIVSYLGHYLQNNSGEFVAVKANELEKSMYNNNLIVIGTPNSNKLVRELNKNMYIKFNGDFNGFLSNNKINLYKDYSDEVASIQLIDSPFNKECSVMIITSVKEEDLFLGGKFLNVEGLVQKLKGNGTIIDRDGNIYYSYFGEKYEREEGKLQNLKSINLNKESKNLIVFVSFIILFMIFISIFFIKKYRRS
ncbi:cellulose biosynthesis cyclic di-GMP-binding regulatory protein BcsB [Clostridium lundense]|uniref:cellulose biosynthesis cyclic di-GMP-binding regulatory protein BcsB n=1 Tax=Clostridium lundense TaxID=319475 RepID=UPI00047FAA64|nr:cellulose biosynthesis cyclic di-GMP-binding regulatory protein BcsB [Clostridium lundense]